MRKGIVIITVILLVVLNQDTAIAHKVGLFAYQEGGIVHTEAYFVDGTPCRNAKITANETGGTVVAEGVTDDDGLFSFPYTLTGDLTISVRAGMGHGREILLTANKAYTMDSSPEREEAPVTEGSAVLAEADIQKIVEDRINPIRESLREIKKKQEKPTLGKILGGLGWIVGMAGAYLWGVSRKSRDKVKG